MTRRRALVAVTLAVALVGAAGVAWAVPQLKARGSVTASAMASNIVLSNSVYGENDGGVLPDPGGPTPFGTGTNVNVGVTREAWHVGSVTVAGVDPAAGTFTVTASGVYSGYKAAMFVEEADSRPWVVADIVVTDNSAAVPGSTPLSAGWVTAGLAPNTCGRALNHATDQQLRYALRFGDVPGGATLAFTIEIRAVPPGLATDTCPTWAALV